MALLTETQLAILRGRLGTELDEDDMQERWDRLGDLNKVVLETLHNRLADLLSAGPASYNVSGVYSEDYTGVISALERQIRDLRAEMAAEVSVGLPDLFVEPILREGGSWRR